QPIQIKLEIVGGDNSKRINIDNLTINDAYNNITITHLFPQGYGISSGNNQLQLVFNEDINKGDSGKIFLYERGGATIAYDINAPEITISNDTAYIDNVMLLPNKDYYILLDSTA